MSNVVKTFDSTQSSAPILSGTIGSQNTVLRTCLQDGYGAATVTSLTVASGIATANYSSGHPFKVNSVGLFSGATPAPLNGEKRILSVTTNSVTFAAVGVADGPATGSISSKMAPAGWIELFNTANISGFKSSAVESSGCVLRVDDTNATLARVVGYESMTDANNGLGPFPSAAQFSGGMYWGKSSAAGAAARPWMLFADDQTFHFWVAASSSYPTHGTLFSFGDILSDKSGDAYRCLLAGGAMDVLSAASPGCLGYGHAGNAGINAYMPRSDLGLGGSQLVKKIAAHNLGAGYSGLSAYNSNALTYPNRPDNSLRLSPVEIFAGGHIRGRVAGVYHSPQIFGEYFQTGDPVLGTGAYAGRTFMALRVGNPNSALSNAGVVFIDITGPWRV